MLPNYSNASKCNLLLSTSALVLISTGNCNNLCIGMFLSFSVVKIESCMFNEPG